MQLHDADSGRTSGKGDQSAKNGEDGTAGDIACDVEACEAKFKTQRLLNAHKKQSHKIGITANMFKCDYEGCGLEFPRQAQLKKHAGVHSGMYAISKVLHFGIVCSTLQEQFSITAC